MALNKEIVTDRGVISNYHRISSYQVDKDNGIVILAIKHYTDDSYRKTEKNNIVVNVDIEKKQQRLTELMRENELTNGKKTNEIVKLTNEINNLYAKKKEVSEMFIYQDVETLPFETNNSYSLEILYNMLLDLEKYQNSDKI